MSSLSRSQTLLAPPGQGVPSQTDGMSSGGEVGATGAVTPSGLAGVGVAVGQIPLRVIYLTIEKRASAPRVYDIPIEAVDTWEVSLSICNLIYF